MNCERLPVIKSEKRCEERKMKGLESRSAVSLTKEAGKRIHDGLNGGETAQALVVARAEGDLEVGLALVADGVGGGAVGDLVRVGPALAEREAVLLGADLDLALVAAVAVVERLDLDADLLVRAGHHADIVGNALDAAPATVAELGKRLGSPLGSGALVGGSGQPQANVLVVGGDLGVTTRSDLSRLALGVHLEVAGDLEQTEVLGVGALVVDMEGVSVVTRLQGGVTCGMLEAVVTAVQVLVVVANVGDGIDADGCQNGSKSNSLGEHGVWIGW